MDLRRRRFLQVVPGGCLMMAASTPAAAEQQAASSPPIDGTVRLETEADWRQVRDCFPMTRELTYLNAGGLGPAPAVVLQAVCDTLHALQRRTNHGHSLIEQARPVVARFLGADPEEIAFMRNATEGNSTIASGLPLQAGDEVIIDTHAHPGGAVAWMTRQKYERIQVRGFEPARDRSAANIERIEQLLSPRTRAIQVSHVTAPTGIHLPVADIGALAKDRNIWFHVDGAQSCGMINFQVSDLNCDSYATSGHKWTCGPTGTGILYVNRARLNDVQPTDVGAYSTAECQIPSHLELVDTARRFECGTRDAATVVGLAEAVKFLDAIGMHRIVNRGRQLAGHLRRRLRELPQVEIISPGDDRLATAMTSFRVRERSSNEVFRHLMDHHFRCRPVHEQGLDAIRVSNHLFNTMAELDALTETLAQV